MTYRLPWSLIVLFAALAGCSNSPPSLTPPTISGNAGTAAVGEYDTNKNGQLDESELRRSAALKSAIERIDQNGDRQLSAAEIDHRIEQWAKSGVALTTVDAMVRLDGRPLSGGEIKLVPEAFLGDAIEHARGIVDERGMARIVISNEPDTAGVRVGLYRIEISKVENGKEFVPSRYNKQSELGVEIAADVQATRNLDLNLKSR
ncbi:MAG: hypothetical protein IT427_03195 [Pirellulales bacterium]|nr:hypothetical protein [Pirellulales bacterium]